jgi:phage tail-like protein
MPNNDPSINFQFRVEIDGMTTANFTEVILPEALTEIIEYREGDSHTTVRKLSGLTTYGNLILSRGLKSDTELYDWWRHTEQGNIERRNLVVVIMDQSGEEQARFEFRETWPIRYKASDLKATGSEVVVETIEIAHEGMRRIS